MSRALCVAVIGAGAAGLMAAQCAAGELKKAGRPGQVLLIEGNPKPGKKLLATGNGRCNLTNQGISIAHYFGDREGLDTFLAKYSPHRIMDEFQRLGLLCRTDGEGRVYPYNLQAAAVLQTLSFACAETGVQSISGSPVFSIVRGEQGFVLKLEDGRELRADKCILASGGMASPRHSCGEGGYGIARQLGHRVIDCRPALAPVKSKNKILRSLKGMRCKAAVTLLGDGKPLAREEGEVIFGDSTLSGICVFDLSILLSEYENTGKIFGSPVKRAELSLDLLQEFSPAQVLSHLQMLQANHPSMLAGDVLSGFINLRVGQEVIKSLGIDRTQPLSKTAGEVLEKIGKRCKDFRFEITGVSSFENAQITAGGIPLNQVELSTMESKIQPGLYLAGELLNVHGGCGGYNLHWAWATGLCAGAHAAGTVIAV